MTVVVIDTNLFVRHTYLCRKQQGPALTGLLRAIGGKIFVPGILRREYSEQTQAMAEEQFDQLQKPLAALKTLTGLPDQINPPGAEAVQQFVEDRLEQLFPITLVGPSIDDVAIAAAHRSVDKHPPTTKSDHGLKDCMIWEAILKLDHGTKAWLATNDNGFYAEGKSDELHPKLRAEADALGIEVKIARKLEPIIEALVAEFPEVDLAEVERKERAEQREVVMSTVPPAPTSPDANPTNGDISAVKAALVADEAVFEQLELKALGYIAYLEPVPKSELVDALLWSGVPIDHASNATGRLVLKGLVRDSGTNYLIANRSIQVAAMNAVESDIIRWLESKRSGHE